MVERSAEQLTLRELFTHSERLIRELIEHLDQDFLPRAHHLRRLTRMNKSDPDLDKVEDVTVRTHAARVLESENFANQLYEKVVEYVTAIDSSVSRIVNEG